MWICPKCGERIEKQFTSCWRCAGANLPPTTSFKPGLPWGRFLLIGLLFEILLFLLCIGMPGESWPAIQIRNFGLVSHFPILAVLGVMRTDSDVLGMLGLVLSCGLMALVWAWCFRTLTNLIGRAAARFGLTSKQKLWICGLLVASCVVVTSPAILAGLNDKPRPFVASAALKTAAAGNTALALDLYQKLAASTGNEANLFFSPHSASVALAMTYAGARGQTELEMATVLHTKPGNTDLHVAFGELADRLDRLGRWGKITLTSASSLWCQKRDPFTDAFLELTRAHYHATVRKVDFQRDAQSAGAEINRWIAQNTKGKFDAVVREQDLTPDTSLILCNTIYFHGRWASPFKRGATRAAPFRVTKDREVSVPMMSQEGPFKTTEATDEQFNVEFLEMPYYGRDLSMIVLLPNDPDGLPELERRLTAEKLQGWLAQLERTSPHKTSVRFPRFTTRSDLDLVPALKALGMASAFNDAADLSGIDGQKNLYLTRALQQALVEVNEEGTKATAITLFEAKTMGMDDSFIANHPFLFLIRENATGSILFLGRVVDPTR